MKILTSWDDGHELDLRVMELLRKYKLPGIFFIPIESWGYSNLEKYKDFEIGCHTYTHPSDLKLLNDKQLYEKTRKDAVEWATEWDWNKVADEVMQKLEM